MSTDVDVSGGRADRTWFGRISPTEHMLRKQPLHVKK